MKFTVNRLELLKKIKDIQLAISNKTTMPILSGLKLEANDEGLKLTGSNSEVSIETKLFINDEKNNLVIAKEAARAWLNTLSLPQSECAITSFDDYNYLNQDFTSDRDQLLTAISTLSAKEGTNYNAALLLPRYGGLRLS